MFNEFKFTETTKAQLAGRIDHVNLKGSTPDFPADFLPDGSELAVSPRSLSFTPVSAGVGVLQNLPWDLVASLASPLPIAVITDLLGVPDDDSAAFARYGATIGSALAGPQSIAHVARLIEADRQLRRLLSQVFDHHRQEHTGVHQEGQRSRSRRSRHRNHSDGLA